MLTWIALARSSRSRDLAWQERRRHGPSARTRTNTLAPWAGQAKAEASAKAFARLMGGPGEGGAEHASERAPTPVSERAERPRRAGQAGRSRQSLAPRMCPAKAEVSIASERTQTCVSERAEPTTRAGRIRGVSAGGEGGIRTHGAFAHRFSRAAPSTTRTPLRGGGYQRVPVQPARLGAA
jgi:hypothetical protein